jgi:hypothetical protein
MNRALASSAVVLLALAVTALPAQADLSRKVIATFKGQILVTAEAIDGAGSDKDTIDAFKKARLKEVKGEPNADEVHSWSFSRRPARPTSSSSSTPTASTSPINA